MEPLAIITLYMLAMESSTLSLELFDYSQSKTLAAGASEGNLDNGGFTETTGGEHRHLGDEVDLVLAYTWSEHCRFELAAGHFVPGDAYEGQAGDESATEVRAEMAVGF